ncbi:MAG: hypothetical protein ACHQQS_11000 [Thermoanaerobaculales bacterium]
MTSNPFLGRWRIADMSEWGSEYLDLVVPAFVEFESNGLGSFQFGAVSGFVDYRVARRADESVIEWSWEGMNDTDPACGRGRATLVGGELVGHLFIHQSDDSEFRAVRSVARRPRSSRRVRGGRDGTV